MPRVKPAHAPRRAPWRLPGRVLRALRPTRLKIVAAGAAIVGGLLLWAEGAGLLSEAREELDRSVIEVSAEAGFTVREVLVQGRRETSAALLRETLGITRGEPTLALDPARLRSSILALPWVADAKVARRLPDLISVELIERRPFARWQLDGRLRVIDRAAEVIPSAEAERFADLPLVVGPGAARAGRRLFAMLERHPGIAERVLAAIRVGERRWNLRFAHGLDVLLPEQDVAKALARLERLMNEQQLLERDLVVIDLRQSDRLVVRPSPGALPALEPEEGQAT